MVYPARCRYRVPVPVPVPAIATGKVMWTLLTTIYCIPGHESRRVASPPCALALERLHILDSTRVTRRNPTHGCTVPVSKGLITRCALTQSSTSEARTHEPNTTRAHLVYGLGIQYARLTPVFTAVRGVSPILPTDLPSCRVWPSANKIVCVGRTLPTSTNYM